jgi:hypothetical protein
VPQHLAIFLHNTILKSSDLEAAQFGGAIGRDLLRLPRVLSQRCWPHLHAQSRGDADSAADAGAAPSSALPVQSALPALPAMIIGGDMNVAKHRLGEGASNDKRSVYGELTARVEWAPADSEDEWEEDGDAPDGAAFAWPPPAGTRRTAVAADLWREAPAEQREHGGLQRGSTAISANLQNFQHTQGVAARAINEGWAEHGPCTDAGHIDWVLASRAGAAVKAMAVGVCTEQVCAPLKPQQPSLLQGAIPAGGAVFASDHYPVWADVSLGLG